MLKVFYGTDRTAVRDAALKESEILGVSPTIIEDITYVSGAVASAVGATSLFGGTECFVLDTPSGDDAFETEVLQSLKELAESPNIFIVLESTLLADEKKKYGKHTTTIEEFAAIKSERFNSFAIAEALAKRDKKNMWVLLHEAKQAGLRNEEIIGMLWWQLKALRLAKFTRSAEEAGMKDFPYKKATQALRNFKDGEVEALSRSLLELYHLGHQGKRDMDLALEEWVLSL